MLKLLTPLLNVVTILIEVGTVFSAANREVCLILLVACSLFNLVIFSVSGILFWEFMLTNLLLALHILALDATTVRLLFNLQNEIIFAAVLIVFPLQKRLWV